MKADFVFIENKHNISDNSISMISNIYLEHNSDKETVENFKKTFSQAMNNTREIKLSKINKKIEIKNLPTEKFNFLSYIKIIFYLSLIALIISIFSYSYNNDKIHFYMNYLGFGISNFIYCFGIYKRVLETINKYIYFIIFLNNMLFGFIFGFIIAKKNFLKKDHIFILIIPIIIYFINYFIFMVHQHYVILKI